MHVHPFHTVHISTGKKRATHGGGGEERPQQWWQLNSKHDYRVQEETNLKDIIDMQLY
jgi:hypothetical protein